MKELLALVEEMRTEATAYQRGVIPLPESFSAMLAETLAFAATALTGAIERNDVDLAWVLLADWRRSQETADGQWRQVAFKAAAEMLTQALVAYSIRVASEKTATPGG